MKKLMFVAALAAAMTGLAEVKSANVVGYATKAMQSGNTACGSSFVAIGREGNLNDIIVTGYGDTYTDGEVMLTRLTADGYVLDDIYWTWYECVDDRWLGTRYGWYSSDDDSEGTTSPLTIGEGLWIQAPDETFLVQSAGEVYTEALPIQLQSGNTLCANPCPVNSLTLNDAEISGYGESYTEGEVMLTRLTSDGYVLDDIYWTWYDCEDDRWLGTRYGWYSSEDDSEGTTSPLTMGEAVWVQAPDESFYLTFPKTLITK